MSIKPNSHVICIILLCVGFAFATTEIRNQDLPADLTISNSFTVNGVTDFGLKTNVEIAAIACTGGVGACRATSSTEGDLYLSTGTIAGQFRNSRTGKGP